MADEQLFTAEGTEQPGQSKGCGRSCLSGCLIVLVILAVLAVLVTFWVARNWRTWSASFMTEAVRQGMVDSRLPAEEQQKIMVQVERLADAWRENKLSIEQGQRLMERMVNSPLLTIVMAASLDQGYLAKSGLSDAEKATARETLKRFIRGAFDGKINEAGVDAAMTHVADRRNGSWRLRREVSDEQLRAFLAEAKQQADLAAIPEQPADVDAAVEIRKLVDEALGTPAELPPATEPTEPTEQPEQPTESPADVPLEPAA